MICESSTLRLLVQDPTDLPLQRSWPRLACPSKFLNAILFLAALCLLFDVAIRRIAIQPEAVWAKAFAVWQKLRRQASADKAPEYIERLRSRKAAVVETIDKKKAAAKFEAAEGTVVPAAPIVAEATPVEKPKAAPAPKPEEDADFATRLMRAKKKAMEDRDKDKK